MNKIKPSQKIYLFFIILSIIQIYYFFIDFFIAGLFTHYGFSLGSGIILLGILIIHGLILLTLFQLYNGIKHRKPWARKFSMFYLGWASLWSIWGLIVGNNILVHSILLLIYISMILYLTTLSVRWYFKKIYRYGKYILYTKIVTLKSGLQLPIYFFSRKQPKSGHPIDLPEGYTVEENKKSHMPYLKKTKNEYKQNKKSSSNRQKTTKIIYVVNNRMDKNHQEPWTIKSHTKTYNYVHTKQKALQMARTIARRLKARVMVQNVNGKFSYGFTPKDK